MAEKTDDGGNAFPWRADRDRDQFSTGMTLRDYFAGRAIAGLVSAAAFNQGAEDMMKKAGIGTDKVDAFLASLAYDTAEAMVLEKRRRDAE